MNDSIKESIKLVTRLRKSIKKSYPQYTIKQINSAIAKASEYNPITFTDAKRDILYVLKQRYD